MKSPSFLSVSEVEKVCYIRLNRPDVRNAFNPEMIAELTEIFSTMSKRKDLAAAVLMGEGKVFCAGADLQWMKMMVNYTFEENKVDAQELFHMFETVAVCGVPVVSLVHGAAYGGAIGLVACCDYVIAEASTDFCFSEVKLGIAPAVISSFILRKCSLAKVMPWMICGENFQASDARDMGLVTRVCNDGEGAVQLASVLATFKQCGPEAVRETKKLLNEVKTLSWQEQKERTSKVIADRRISSEGQEGLKSFLEKRQPFWRQS